MRKFCFPSPDQWPAIIKWKWYFINFGLNANFLDTSSLYLLYDKRPYSAESFKKMFHNICFPALDQIHSFFLLLWPRERENYKNSIQKRVPPPKKAISRLMNPIPSSIKHSRVLTFFFMTTTKNYFIKGTSLPIVYKHSSYEHSTMSVGIFKKSANCKRKTWQLVSGNQPKNRFFKVGWTRLFVIFLGGGGKKWRKALVTTCL